MFVPIAAMPASGRNCPAGANRRDMKLAEPTLNGLMVPRPPPTAHNSQGLCLNKGYDYDAVHLAP